MGSYGKIKNHVKSVKSQARKKEDDLQPKSQRIKFSGRYTLEELVHAFNVAIAHLNDQGVETVQGCNLYLTPIVPDQKTPEKGFTVKCSKGKFRIEDVES